MYLFLSGVYKKGGSVVFVVLHCLVGCVFYYDTLKEGGRKAALVDYIFWYPLFALIWPLLALVFVFSLIKDKLFS